MDTLPLFSLTGAPATRARPEPSAVAVEDVGDTAGDHFVAGDPDATGGDAGRVDDAEDAGDAADDGARDASRAASDRGARLHLAGDADGAAAAYGEALELDPANATAHNNLGFLLAQAGDLDEAVRHYETALRLDPGRGVTLANLGMARALQGDE